MKKLLILALLLSQSAPAFAYHINARKILGAPFFAIGFTAALVADVTVYRLYKGAKHYDQNPPIKGW